MDESIERAAEDHPTNLRELRAFRAEYVPVDVDDFLQMFAMLQYHRVKTQRESESYRRQQEEEKRREGIVE